MSLGSPMSDDELLAQLDVMERQAVGYFDNEIAGEQAKAMDYYLSKPFGNEEDGRSDVISSDVWDVVEGMTPQIAKPFFASDDLVKFNPVSPQDEQAAKQETEYVNWLVVQKNDSFNEIVAAIKTGLLQKNAIAKYWWETSTRSTIERYEGLTDDQFALILQDPNIKVVQHSSQTVQVPGIDPQSGQQVMQEETTHDCQLRVSHEHGEAKWSVLAPEEVLVGRDTRSTNLKSGRYVAHITRKTLSELREMGYDVADDIPDDNTPDTRFSPQYQARRNAEESEYHSIMPLDPALREVTFKDELVRIDYDGDGIAELRRICRVGREIFVNEETEEVNFVAWTPYVQPFKFYGRCPADETIEIQRVKTTLWRQSLDNIYTINNNRVYASEGVNLDDLLDNQIAGVVRVDTKGQPIGGHVMSAEIQPIGAVVQPMIEYLDSAKENRTGFSRYNQGAADLGNQKTLGEVQIVTQQSNQRADLIARTFAEQFLKPLMLGVHGLVRRHATQAETVQIRGQWVNVDPRDWVTRTDMTISVGLGNADQQMQMQAAQQLIGAQMNFAKLQIPGLVSPENFYNSAAKLAESMGEKSPEKYFTDPANSPPPSPPDPMQDPNYMLEVAKHKQKDREMDQKHEQAMAELRIRERDSVINGLVAAGNMEANIAKAIQEPTLMSHLERVQKQLESLQTQAATDTGEDGQEEESAETVPQENPEPPQIAMGAQPGGADGQA